MMEHGEAVPVLQRALRHHDLTFTRAEASLRISLATALIKGRRQEESQAHARRAVSMSSDLGSARLDRQARAMDINTSEELGTESLRLHMQDHRNVG